MSRLLGHTARVPDLQHQQRVPELWRRVPARGLGLPTLRTDSARLLTLHQAGRVHHLPAGILPQLYKQLPGLLIFGCTSWLPPLQLQQRLPVLQQWLLPRQQHLPPLFACHARLFSVFERQRLHRLCHGLLPQRCQPVSALFNCPFRLHLLFDQRYLSAVPGRLLPFWGCLFPLRQPWLLNLQRHHPHQLHHLHQRILHECTHLYRLRTNWMPLML